jgi:response regulator RpfG family c-di-GMP phosphodiesterase
MKILIADDEIDILDINSFLVEEIFQIKHEIITAETGNSAIEILSKGDIDLCICDHNMPNGTGCDVSQYLFKNKFKTKLVLCSSVLPEDLPNDYGPDKLYFNIVKPDIESGIRALYEKLSKECLIAKADQLDATDNTAYTPVSVNLLFLFAQLPCDIYVSISNEKFLKCFNENENFSIADQKKYLDKGVSHLFILSAEGASKMNKKLNDCLLAHIQNEKKPLHEKMMDVHFQVTALLRNHGITEEFCAVAKESINNTVKDMLKNDQTHFILKRLNLMGEYPSKLYVLQSTLCGVMSRKLSWCSEPTLQKLVTAAFFQDLTLDSVKLMKIIDYTDFLKIKSTLSDKEINNYLEHSLKSKEFINKIKGIPPDVDKIILEQHEMPNGEGFPRKLTSKNISPLSAVFILSGIISKKILAENPNYKLETYLIILESQGYGSGNFKECFAILRSIFNQQAQ